MVDESEVVCDTPHTGFYPRSSAAAASSIRRVTRLATHFVRNEASPKLTANDNKDNAL